jgi:hypothetical protein
VEKTDKASHGGTRIEARIKKKEGLMNVLGHEDVAVEEELVTAAEGFEGVQEDGSGVVVVEIREPVVRTEGEEVEMAFGLVSLSPQRSKIAGDPGLRRLGTGRVYRFWDGWGCDLGYVGISG